MRCVNSNIQLSLIVSVQIFYSLSFAGSPPLTLVYHIECYNSHRHWRVLLKKKISSSTLVFLALLLNTYDSQLKLKKKCFILFCTFIFYNAGLQDLIQQRTLVLSTFENCFQRAELPQDSKLMERISSKSSYRKEQCSHYYRKVGLFENLKKNSISFQIIIKGVENVNRLVYTLNTQQSFCFGIGMSFLHLSHSTY